MHKYVAGYWAASTYTSKGDRTDQALYFSPDGSFRWATETGDRREERTGTWVHDTDQDVLRLTSGNAKGESVTILWEICYVSGCEDANTILVLRWLALASRNLPILFSRVHPPDDPVWRVGSTSQANPESAVRAKPLPQASTSS